MTDAKWDRRIRRANELISTYPFSAEGLRFYVGVATFQKGLYRQILKALADSPKIPRIAHCAMSWTFSCSSQSFPNSSR